MLKNLLILFLIGSSIITTSFAQSKKGATALSTKMDSVSYSIGMNLVKTYLLDEQLGKINLDLVAQGIKDYHSAKGTLIKTEICDSLLIKYQVEIQQKNFENASATNKKSGEDFLAKNKMEAGVISLPSGLQFKVITSGKGNSPSLNDTVILHYKGNFIDGQIFDDSKQRNQPVVVPVNAVLKGWQEALPMMKEGDKWIIYVPPHLAYSEKGFANVVGPNETLIFEIELLAIK
jgi:FKBP-type peptidyl-prolyl cis-trans isomerase FklB